MPEESQVEQPVPVAPEPQAPAVEAPAAPAAPESDAQSQEPEAKAEGDENQPRDDKGRFKNPTQERIDELTRKRREAEREAEYWRQRANPAKAEAETQKPAVGDFSDYDQYVEALADWKADQKVSQALKARDAETAHTAEQNAQEAKVHTFQERLAQAKTAIADFDQVVNAADVSVAPHVQEAILESEKGGELLYHLAKHPELAERLSGMSVREADREIGRIEATLGQSKAPATVTKPASKAPEPMRPGGRGNPTSVTSDPGKMSHEEYRAMRKAQGARWA